MSERYKSVLFFGSPGTGKGTQGAILGAVPGFFHLSTGDMFRGLDEASELGKEFLRFSERGELVPDEFTVRLWEQHMHDLVAKQRFDPARHLLLLDGIPRTMTQVELLDPHVEVLRIVCLVCRDEDVVVKRLQKRAREQRRPDDAEESIVRRRLQIFRDETRPLLDHYPEDLVAFVDAVGTPAEVLRSVLDVVAPVQRDHFGNSLT